MTGPRPQLAAVLQVASEVAIDAPADAAGDAAGIDRPGETRGSRPPLSPEAAALVRRHGLAPLASRAGYPQLRADFIRAAVAAALRAQDLDEAVAALAAARVPVVLLKGVSYAPALYADPALRPMTDIDLMVPAAAHADAVKALCRLGYWRAGGPADRAPTHHAVTLKRPRGAVDLHRRIVQPWRSRIDEAALWRRARPAAERGDGALRLDPIDELLVHLVHIARHELMVPLINYVDAARLLAREACGAAVAAELPARPTAELPAGVPAELPAGVPAELLDRARAYRVRRAVDAALRATRRVMAREPTPAAAWRPAAQPSPAEIAAARRVWRPLQLARKALLVDGPAQLAGLAAAWACERARRL